MRLLAWIHRRGDLRFVRLLNRLHQYGPSGLRADQCWKLGITRVDCPNCAGGGKQWLVPPSVQEAAYVDARGDRGHAPESEQVAEWIKNHLGLPLTAYQITMLRRAMNAREETGHGC